MLNLGTNSQIWGKKNKSDSYFIFSSICFDRYAIDPTD